MLEVELLGISYVDRSETRTRIAADREDVRGGPKPKRLRKVLHLLRKVIHLSLYLYYLFYHLHRQTLLLRRKCLSGALRATRVVYERLRCVRALDGGPLGCICFSSRTPSFFLSFFLYSTLSRRTSLPGRGAHFSPRLPPPP